MEQEPLQVRPYSETSIKEILYTIMAMQMQQILPPPSLPPSLAYSSPPSLTSIGAVRLTTPPKQVAPPTSNGAVAILPPPQTQRVSPSPPPPSLRTTEDPLLVGVTPSPSRVVPLKRRESQDDSSLRMGLLEVKTTLPKAVSLVSVICALDVS